MGENFLLLWLDTLGVVAEKGKKQSSRGTGQDLLRAVLWMHELEVSLQASPGLRSNKELTGEARRAWESVEQHVQTTGAGTTLPDELGMMAKTLVMMQPGSEDMSAVKSWCNRVFTPKGGKPSPLWLCEAALLEAANKLCSCLLLQHGKDSSNSISLYGETSRRYASTIEAVLVAADPEALKAKPRRGRGCSPVVM